MNSVTAKAFRAIATSRQSCRRFQPNRTVPQAVLKDIIEVTNVSVKPSFREVNCKLDDSKFHHFHRKTSPSGFNLQPTNVIIVQDPEVKTELANRAMLGPGNVFRAIDCSAIAVFLSDLEPQKRINRIVHLEKQSNSRTKEYVATLPLISTFLMGEGSMATTLKQIATHLMSPVQPMPTIDSIQAWSYKNTSLMAQTFVLAATSHGLGTCLMEGFDSRRAQAVLKIPDRYAVPLMCCFGYEFEEEQSNKKNRAPRLELNEVFFSDVFGQDLDLRTNHDDTLRDDKIQAS
jgi:nitroreductase